MAGWWRRKSYFVEYMIHEATAVFVALYAAILLTGLIRLAQGRQAWQAWVEWLAGPLSLAVHGLILIAFLYHAWTWFQIMPRTLPPIVIKGKTLSAAAITRIGLVAAAAASVATLALACWLSP
jgi:fumarate reductase subunit C